MAEERIDRAERDIQRLFDRQDKQADAFEHLRRDLKSDLAATEERLERRIAESHTSVVSEIGKVETHLESQDELLRQAFQRDDDLIAARIDWPSWKNVVRAVIVIGVASVLAHYVFGVTIG